MIDNTDNKLKIIFLDCDGVLNGYGFGEHIGWKIACFLKNKYIKNWYRRVTDPCGVHESKMKRLAKIVKKTGAKVVMSSSWRIGWWKRPYEDMFSDQKKLTDLFKKYNIEVIDITPSLRSGKRDEEILQWLFEHENEVENFIILDDENSFMRKFDNDERFIQTSTATLGQMICGHWRERTGLKGRHTKKAIQILNTNKKDKCESCPNFQYVYTTCRNDVCSQCIFNDAVDEFKEALKDTWLYKSMIKFLDWLSERLEK